MINDNDDIKKGYANGTICRVISIKRKSECPLDWRNYDGKKVFVLNVKDADYVELEHFPPPKEQLDLENNIKMKHEELKKTHDEQLRKEIEALEKL